MATHTRRPVGICGFGQFDGSSGKTSAHVSIPTAAASIWQIDFQTGTFALSGGRQYQVDFWAMSDTARSIRVVTQGAGPQWPYYGLTSQVTLGSGSWEYYSLTFVAPVTATDAKLEFWLGGKISNVWLNNVQVFANGK